MALNGSVHTNDYETRYYTVDWTADQSVGNNSSTIHWTLSCAGGKAYGGAGWYAERDLRVYVAGNLVVNKTDFVKIAEAFGAKGYLLDDDKNVEKTVKAALAESGVTVVDCKIEKDELVLPMIPPGKTMHDIITEIPDGKARR